MSRWRNNGGWNKSHGTVEKTPRIDSFDSAISEGGGALFVCADGVTRLIDCDHYIELRPAPGGRSGDRGAVEGRMEPSPGAVPQRKRVRRQSALFPLSGLWGAGAVSVPDRGRVPVPQMLQAELSEPTGNPERLYVLLQQGDGLILILN